MKTEGLVGMKAAVGIPAAEIKRVNRLLDGPSPIRANEIFYEREVHFHGEVVMLLQAIACSDPAEGGWTQGVLFEKGKDGLMHEVGCTDVGEDFDGEYEIDHNGTRYAVEVFAVKGRGGTIK